MPLVFPDYFSCLWTPDLWTMQCYVLVFADMSFRFGTGSGCAQFPRIAWRSPKVATIAVRCADVCERAARAAPVHVACVAAHVPNHTSGQPRCVRPAMPRSHMTEAEVATADALQKQGHSAREVLATLQKERRKAGGRGPSQSAVYRFLKGDTYKRGASEQRGRPVALPPDMVSVAEEVRMKLMEASNSQFMVTWSDIYKETKRTLKARGLVTKSVKMPSEDWFTRTMRAQTEVRARPGKRRITHEKDYKARRYELAKQWVKLPKSWWQTRIHAYIDNKHFVVARTAEMKKRLRTQRVTRHLRTPSEGMMDCFVLPKRSRSLLGIPSVEVTAAVAQDRIIMWRETSGKWNGAQAAQMYADLGEALRTHYGDLRRFRVVEDGDTKGFQSGKGVKAKKEQKIESWTLPPHSPGLMPLDFSLWDDIEGRLLAKRKVEDESMASYKRRLHSTAKRTRASIIQNCLSKMKQNLQVTVASKGGHTQLD